jgi:hypothetical protein
MFIRYFEVFPERKRLELKVEIKDDLAFSGVYIDRVALGVGRDIGRGYPRHPRWEHVFTDERKEASFSIPIHEAFPGLPHEEVCMYVAWVRVKGALMDVPCCCVKDPEVGVAVDFRPLYDDAMHLVEGFVKGDNKSRGQLIDLYLKKNFFLDAIKQEDYLTAVRFLEEFLEEDLCRQSREYSHHKYQEDGQSLPGCEE